MQRSARSIKADGGLETAVEGWSRFVRQFFLQGATPYPETTDIRSCLAYFDDLGEQPWFEAPFPVEITLRHCREALQTFKKTITETGVQEVIM